ncbi:MAG: iron chaperone [Christensenellales bacterium]
MSTFEEYLSTLDAPLPREKTAEVLAWVAKTFPELERRIAWNQPMFLDHGTFIIAFSVAKEHLAISPEWVGMQPFMEELKKKGHRPTKMLFRFKWEEPFDYDILQRIIQFNITDKAQCSTFWRKRDAQK